MFWEIVSLHFFFFYCFLLHLNVSLWTLLKIISVLIINFWALSKIMFLSLHYIFVYFHAVLQELAVLKHLLLIRFCLLIFIQYKNKYTDVRQVNLNCFLSALQKKICMFLFGKITENQHIALQKFYMIQILRSN